jgi:hypothetical protein
MPRGGKREGAGAKLRADVKATNRSIKFTDTEWAIVGRKAVLLNKTISDYIRRKALE